jgi:hypothetical protein
MREFVVIYILSTFSLAVKDVELKSLSLVVHRFESCSVYFIFLFLRSYTLNFSQSTKFKKESHTR